MGLLAGCASSFAELPRDDGRRLSVPALHDREWASKEDAEAKGRLGRQRADRAARLAEMQWRQDSPSEARQIDAVVGLEPAILRQRRAVRCWSGTRDGQTWTSCN